jgi:hypothetical protein
VGTAKTRLHRARRHLAEVCRCECVNEDGPDGATFCTPKATSRPAETESRGIPGQKPPWAGEMDPTARGGR